MFSYQFDAQGRLKSFQFFPIENKKHSYLATLNGKNLYSPVKIKTSFISEITSFQHNPTVWGDDTNILEKEVSYIVKITTSSNDVYHFVFDGLDFDSINERARNSSDTASIIDTFLSNLFGYPMSIYADSKNDLVIKINADSNTIMSIEEITSN